MVVFSVNKDIILQIFKYYAYLVILRLTGKWFWSGFHPQTP